MAPTLAGPSWTATGKSPIDAGRFPLGVEPATLANAAWLVPGVNSGTAHARYYALHAAVAAQAPAQRGAPEKLEEARERVRRAEVVLAAATLRHVQVDRTAHDADIPLRDPHGARVLGPAVQSGTLDVADLATRYSSQPGGFLSVYRGAEITLGLLDEVAGTLAPGPVAFPTAADAPLRAVVSAARQEHVSVSELDALLPAACICAVRSSTDGAQLRGVLFGGPGAPAAPEPIRQARARTARSARLLLAALSGKAVGTTPDDAMAELCCFSDLESSIADEAQRTWAMYWRGALLRNASVTAWRWLWWWLTEQLHSQPRSAVELGDALADTLVEAAGSDRPAREALLSSLPTRVAEGKLRDAETVILYPGGKESTQPFDHLRCLVLGALRLDDLAEGPARSAFCRAGELSPVWVRRWLDDLGGQSLSTAARSLTGVLLRQAEEISRQRARWDNGRLRLPTRLRQVGEVLDLAGEEGTVVAGLRLGRLTQILGELDVLGASNGTYCRGAAADPQW